MNGFECTCNVPQTYMVKCFNRECSNEVEVEMSYEKRLEYCKVHHCIPGCGTRNPAILCDVCAQTYIIRPYTQEEINATKTVCFSPVFLKVVRKE